MRITAEPETIDELISDCAQLPYTLRAEAVITTPRPPAPRAWTVDETCHAQVADLDEYV